MIWATVSSQSCFCWLYRAFPSFAAKTIINPISVLTIWWCPCVESSLVLLENGVCYYQCVFLVTQRLQCLPPMRETQVRSLGQEDPLEKEMVTHICILAWKIPWTEKPGRLQSMGSQRVRHNWVTSLSLSLSWQNSSSLCPASFRIPRPSLPVTPGVSWLPTFAFQPFIIKRTSFGGVIYKKVL